MFTACGYQSWLFSMFLDTLTDWAELYRLHASHGKLEKLWNLSQNLETFTETCYCMSEVMAKSWNSEKKIYRNFSNRKDVTATLQSSLCKKIVYDLYTTLLITQNGNFGHGIIELGHGIVIEFS